MKKSLVSLLVVLFALSIATVAMANPVTLDGSASLQYRYNHHNQWPAPGNDGSSGVFTKMIINGQTDFGLNLKLYSRFGMQGVNKPDAQPVDFNTSVHSGNYVAEIDQFGLVYSNGGFVYKLGRQDATIGATAILYNNNFMIGKQAFVDGVTITGDTGLFSVKGIVAKENKSGYVGDGSNKIYALSGNIHPTKNLTVGATVAKYDTKTTDTNHYAVNAALNVGKATFVGEFAKSDASTDNKAYDFGVSYAIDPKVSVFATLVRVENQASMGGKTDFENNSEGVHYGAVYNVTKDTTVDVFVVDVKDIKTKAKYDSYRTTVTFKF